MANIDENFLLTKSEPIDNRLLVGTGYLYETKEDIVHKYDGLRIWDLDNGQGWIWYNSTWNMTNADVISGSGTDNHVPKFSTGGQIVDSIIVQIGGNIGIGLNITPNEKLHINGNLKANGFIGDGSNLNNLDASSVTSGTLDLDRIKPGNDGDVLTTDNGVVKWVSSTSLFGSVESSETVYHELGTEDSYKRVLFMKNDDTYSEIRTTDNSGGILVNTSTGKVKSNNIGIGTDPVENYSLNLEDGFIMKEQFYVEKLDYIKIT